MVVLSLDDWQDLLDAEQAGEPGLLQGAARGAEVAEGLEEGLDLLLL